MEVHVLWGSRNEGLNGIGKTSIEIVSVGENDLKQRWEDSDGSLVSLTEVESFLGWAT